MRLESKRTWLSSPRGLTVLAGVLAAAAVVMAAVGMFGDAVGEDPTVVKLPEKFHFRCTACDHSWTSPQADTPKHFGGGLPTTLRPVVCPKCGKRTAYMLAQCPFCKKHYIHKHLLDGSTGRAGKDICPHCGKDTFTWKR